MLKTLILTISLAFALVLPTTASAQSLADTTSLAPVRTSSFIRTGDTLTSVEPLGLFIAAAFLVITFIVPVSASLQLGHRIVDAFQKNPARLTITFTGIVFLALFSLIPVVSPTVWLLGLALGTGGMVVVQRNLCDILKGKL